MPIARRCALPLVLAVVSAGMLVHARQDAPVFSFAPTSVPAGSYVNFFGSGFSASGTSSASVTLIDEDGRRRRIGSLPVFSDGSVSGAIVPISDLSLPGIYRVQVRDDTTGAFAINQTGRLRIIASPQFQFSPGAGTIGGVVRFAGSGFAPGSRAVSISLRAAAGGLTALGTVRLVPTPTGLRGFAKSVPLAPPVEPGVYTVIVRDRTTRQLAQNRTGPLTVASPSGPDLQLTSLSDPPPQVVTCPVCPASIPVADTTSNAGLGASGPTRVQFYLSLDRRRSPIDWPIGSRALPALGPAETSPATTEVGVPFANGTFFLLACADVPNVVPEVDELDNCRASRTRMTIIFIPD